MRDILQQAIDELTPRQRAACNRHLAAIQNERNAHHQEYCDLPGHDLSYALRRFRTETIRMAAWHWDSGYIVKGLS